MAPGARAGGRLAGEEGMGMVPSLAGVVVFLAFVLFAVQLLFNLYATSAVTAAAYDAARIVAGSAAGSGTSPLATRAAEDHARQVLGAAGDAATFTWDIDADTVALRVVSPNPRFLLPALGGALGFDTVDRTVRVRVEHLR